MSRASRVEIDGREYYREAPRRRDHDDVEVRIRDRSQDRLPSFMREDRRPEPGPLVLRQREVEERVIRRRSPSPVRVRETRIVRARSVSPIPQRRTEEDVRFRTVEKVRAPSRGPDIDKLRARILSRDRSRRRSRSSSSSSSSDASPARERIRARIVERARSPSPVRTRSRSRVRIVAERREEKVREPSPQPPPREVIKGPVIEREVITHYRDIDHGVISLRPPSPPPPPRQQERNTEIDIYTSRSETEVDIHRSRSHTRGRSRSRSHERVSHPHRHHHHGSGSWDDGVLVHAESKNLHVDVEARHSHSHNRRAHSAVPFYRDDYDEAREITSKIDSRGQMGEARNGITKDWTIIDVPPGTERVRMDGAGGASAEVTWQKYSGVRRSRFIPDRDEKSVVSASSATSERRERDDSRRGSRLSVQIYDKSDKEDDRRVARRSSPQRSEMWTEITKDLVIREAIEEMGYEYEETEWFFYIMSYLRYEDVLQLVQLSDAVRKARKDRLTEITWERERGYQDDWDREYRIHAHHHHHHDGGSRHRSRRHHHDDRIVESEVMFESSRGSKYY